MSRYYLSSLLIIIALSLWPHLSVQDGTQRNDIDNRVNSEYDFQSAFRKWKIIADLRSARVKYHRVGPRHKLHHNRVVGSFGAPGPAQGPSGLGSATTAGGFDGEGGNVFRAFWNVPDYCGERHGIYLPLADFGIEFNSNYSGHHGDVVNTFGLSEIGLFPYLDANNRFVHGGLPQLGNISAHIEKATADIMAAIPDRGVGGIGMLDLETWYPQWQTIESRYRDFSAAHVRRLHPEWDEDTVTLVAELEWTQGARLYMESTLKLVKRMVPNAVWGFYHYPKCNTVKFVSCRPSQPALNDQLMWLFNESTVFYPSIYLIGLEDSAGFVDARLTEAFRVREKSLDPKGVVLSYTLFNYSHTNYFYTLEDLNNTILKSAEFGTHGVVLWGDDYDDATAGTCHELQAYVENALGPAVILAKEGAQACSQRVCSGHGRCVGKILSCGKSLTDRKRRQYQDNRIKSTKANDSCSCRCFHGWSGVDCSQVE